jgi:hypothetical protein
MLYIFFTIVLMVKAFKDTNICANCKFAILDKNNLIQSKCSFFEKTKLDCILSEKNLPPYPRKLDPFFKKMEKIYLESRTQCTKDKYLVTGKNEENGEFHDCLTARKFESMCGREGKYFENSSHTSYQGTVV